MEEKREKLPSEFEKKYKSEKLKEKIADIGMWGLIPAVTGPLNSAYGKKRIIENDSLFSFIDRYVPDVDYDFEPNMRDGRYVFLPGDVGHQGIGISASLQMPGLLEIAHFWYPDEFTERHPSSLGGGQVYVCNFMVLPGEELAQMVRRIYINEKPVPRHYCTFPFTLDKVVTLKGNFLDHKEDAIKLIRETLKDETPGIKRNGEGIIMFMETHY